MSRLLSLSQNKNCHQFMNEKNNENQEEEDDNKASSSNRQEQLSTHHALMRACTLPWTSPATVKRLVQNEMPLTIAGSRDDEENRLWKLISAVHAHNTNARHAEEIVKLLCRHSYPRSDCTSEQSTKGNFSLLHRACASSTIPPSTVQTLLLERGGTCLVNCRDQDGRTPLRVVCMPSCCLMNHQTLTNAIEKVRILLQAGADCSAADASALQDTPLHVVCKVDGPMFRSISRMAARERSLYLQHKQTLLQLLLLQQQNGRGVAPVHAVNSLQQTPLLIACRAKFSNCQAIAALLAAGANVNCCDKQGETPLHAFLKHSAVSVNVTTAASRNSNTGTQEEGDPGLEIVKMLVAAGADLTARDASGRTPLWYTLQNPNEHNGVWTRVLLEAGANPNAPCSHSRRTLLHATCEAVRPSAVQALIEFGAHLNALDDNGLSPLFLAIRVGAKECIQSLVQAGVHICPATNYPIHYLCDGQEDVEILRMLLQGGVKVDAVDEMEQTPLLVASGRGRLEAMQALLDFGANVNATDSNQRTPLHKACQGNFWQAARLLLQHGASVNAPDIVGRTPVDESCSTSQVDLLQMLVGEFQANVNIADNGRKPPLVAACESRNIRGVEILLDYGADINGAGPDGETALHVACRRVDLHEFIPLLQSRGANVNILDHAGRTPLMAACRGNHAENAELLLSLPRHHERQDVNLNLVDHQGNTAIHYACQHGNLRLVQILLSRGATVSLRDQQGQTPFQLATCQGFASITYYLLQQNGSMHGL